MNVIDSDNLRPGLGWLPNFRFFKGETKAKENPSQSCRRRRHTCPYASVGTSLSPNRHNQMIDRVELEPQQVGQNDTLPAPGTAIRVRPSSEVDVPAMIAIYTYHIQHGLGDYEIEPFQSDDLKRRRKTMLKRRLPHLVADKDGKVVGYAYAVPFRKRPAYRYTV